MIAGKIAGFNRLCCVRIQCDFLGGYRSTGIIVGAQGDRPARIGRIGQRDGGLYSVGKGQPREFGWLAGIDQCEIGLAGVTGACGLDGERHGILCGGHHAQRPIRSLSQVDRRHLIGSDGGIFGGNQSFVGNP